MVLHKRDSGFYTLRLAGGGAVLANDTTNQTFCVAKERVDKKMPPHPAS